MVVSVGRCLVVVSGVSFSGGTMLRWALAFLIVAIVAGILGLSGVAIISAEIAKALFVIFLIGFLITLVLGLTVSRKITR